MQKLLQIKMTKVNSESHIEVNPTSTVAITGIAFKDICITLRTSQKLFDLSMNDSGNCQIDVFNHSSIESDISSLTKEELQQRIKFYSDNWLIQRQFLERIPIYRHLEQVQNELTALYKAMLVLESKERILIEFGDKIEFYNNQLFFTMCPSHLVEITQEGFQFEEVKSLMKGVFGKFHAKYSFLYNVNFDTLVFK